MKKLLILTTALSLALSGCTSVQPIKTTKKTPLETLNIKGLVLVEENKATLNINNVNYRLNSYIKLFQQPYYVEVIRTDRKPISKNTATSVAKTYIKPRGCTQTIQLAPKLNQHTADNTQWIIGILC